MKKQEKMNLIWRFDTELFLITDACVFMSASDIFILDDSRNCDCK